ncbi:MAG: NUDIX hydrolase [Steroidobacterales bacterium]
MQKPARIASRRIHRGRVIEVSTERLRYANGREYDMDLIHHPGAAAVVPVDEKRRVCLVRQYRLGIEDFMWEIPAGKLDAGEAPETCAVRELQEETGIVASRWSPLGMFIPAPGIYTERIFLYLAQGLSVGTAAPDIDEELELQWLPLKEAVAMVLSGEWSDGKTAVALLRADYQLKL